MELHAIQFKADIEKMVIEQTYLGVGNYYEFSEKYKLIKLICREFFYCATYIIEV